ncbi:MAG: hypothetical protein F4017_11925 [Acidimicrobiaceae bacterium]|nr:hypothetical protein [Acidimicrobiaceae bacterium]
MNATQTAGATGREATLTAELLADAIRNAHGHTGVLIRDLNLDAVEVCRQLSQLRAEGFDLRIAYLNPAASEAAHGAGISGEEFDTSVEQAERWRNQRGLDALIVVVSESDQAKLTSLEDFVLIGPSSLRRLLVERAQLELSKINDVLPRWWSIIGQDEQTSFFDLLDYFLALEGLGPEEVKEAAATSINMLGLLPDPALFDDPSEKQLRNQLEEIRSLALRLANFSEDDRTKVEATLAAEEDPARRTQLQAQLRTLQRHRRGGEMELSASDARELLKAKTRKPKPKPKPKPNDDPSDDPPRPPPTSLTALAAEALLRPTAHDAEPDGGDSPDQDDADDTAPASLAKVVSELTSELDNMEPTVRPEPIRVNLPSGAQIDGAVQTDVVSLVGRMVDEDKCGGLVRVVGADIATMIRNFQQSGEIVESWDLAKIAYLIKAFAEIDPQFDPIREAFEHYATARQALLPMVRELCVEPLLVAVSPSAPLVAEVVETYQRLVAVLRAHHTALHDSFAEDTRALIERVLLIDTVFLKNDSSLVGLLTPLHPLLLWHYREYTRVVANQRDDLEARDRELVFSELDQNGVPLFLPSLGVPRLVTQKAALSLPYAGKFGGLPQFSEEANASDPKDGLEPIRRLLEAFIDMHPSSAEGLRLAVLEPPDAAQFLLACCDLADRKDAKLRGAHITVLRSRAGVGAELDLSADEERRIQQRFGDHADRRFTFETIRVAEGRLAPPDGLMCHLYIAVDQTKRKHASASGQPQRIQPLANRRRLKYLLSSDTLDLEPEPGGILADYSKLAQLAVGSDILSYSLIHQAEDLRTRLREGARQVPWYVVVDGHVDRDLDIGGLRVLTARERTRDVAAFARSNDAFRRSLRDVVRQFNTAVNDETLDSILESLSELLDSGLLALRPGKSGDIVVPHVKGILGLMVAVKHLRDTAPSGSDRIVLSLDSHEARRWLHLHDNQDNSRSDLLVIDGSDGQFTVTIVEVKAHQNVAAEYSVTDGIATGPAISQMLSTYQILQPVFDADSSELLLTPSRREVIRDHLYRELSKASYDKAARMRWEQLARQLLDEDTQVDLRCELVHVQLGVAATSLEPRREVRTRIEDELIPVSLKHLNEEGVPELETALTPPEPPETPQEPPPGPQSDNGRPPSGGPSGASTDVPVQTEEPEAETPDSDIEATVPADDDPTVSRPRALIGVASGSFAGGREVFFDPQDPDEKLNNPHISITGETGTGKTQATKAILSELLPLGIPALILAFKDDYAKPDYASVEGLTVHDAALGALPFNPMVPPIDKMTGHVNPTTHLHELGNTLQRIYGLGDQQAFALREAMKETYAISGVGSKPFVPEPTQRYLPFEAIKDVLEREKSTALLGRLSPVFDLGVFSEGDAALTLSDLLETPTVIRLSQLPGDQVKNAVAEFFLMAMHSYLMRREQPHALRQVLVLDEAWRLVASRFLKPLMLEGRAYGLGVIVATQFPRQLPEEVSGSTATRLFFGQTKAEQIREVQRTLVGKTSGPDADNIAQVVRSLAPLECVMQNAQHAPWVRVKVTPYYARLSEEPFDE